MFFVFGPSGQMYRGGPENLAHISAVRSVQRTQNLQRHRSADETSAQQATSVASPVNLRAAGAMSAYADTSQILQPQQRQPLTLVRDVMTEDVLTVQPHETLGDSWKRFSQLGVAQAPVVDSLGRLVGLLLRADMLPREVLPSAQSMNQAQAPQIRTAITASLNAATTASNGTSGDSALPWAQQPVSAVMLSPVPSVMAEAPLRRVAGVLLDTGLPGLPVTNELGVLSGFVSRNDILRAVAADPPIDLWSGQPRAL